MIRVEGVWKSFGRNAVLRGLDLEVPTGSVTIIIGRSGGGMQPRVRFLSTVGPEVAYDRRATVPP